MERTLIRRASAFACLALLVVLGLGPAAFGAPSRAHSGTSPLDGGSTCSWVHVPAPKVNGGLDALVTLSLRDAWAVGFVLIPDNFGPLVLHFDGSSWSEVPVEPPSGRLNAIAAASAGDMWAVGQDGDGATLALHFDGTEWSRVPTPTLGIYAYFLGVAAPASDDVWAVGDWEDSHLRLHPLMEHWDGSAWEIVPVADGAFFEDVSASGSSDVWAVGSGFGGASIPFLHFDGTQWTAVPGPAISDPYSLYGIHAVAPGQAWAVGYRVSQGGQGPDKALALRWDGLSWRVERTPSVSANLEGVTIDQLDHPIAVGYVEEPTTTFAIRKQGEEFVRMASWNPPHATFTLLADVAMVPSSDSGWTVGEAGTPAGELRPVIERLSCGTEPRTRA
jgi:hypothetical protein